MRAFLNKISSNLPNLDVFEIGARGAPFEDLKGIGKYVNYHGFEPDPDECDRLNSLKTNSGYCKLKYYPTAISNDPNKLLLNITKQPGCSSSLKPNISLLEKFNRSEWHEVDNKIEVEAITLKELVDQQSIKKIDYLKVDVEGMELSVIKSLSKHLKSVVCIRVEVSFIKQRFNQTDYLDLMSYLEQESFIPFAILESHNWRMDSVCSDSMFVFSRIPFSRGQLVHGDILFIKDFMTDSVISDLSDEQLINLFRILYSYGFYSHCQHILSSSKLSQYLAKHEIDIPKKLFLSDSIKSLIKGFLFKIKASVINFKTQIRIILK